jgi:hypothetical protein
LTTTKEVYAFTVFERVFKEFGLPKAIRTDNGVPFASGWALFGLSKLACGGCAWASTRAHQARHPEQNGRHERMHLTLEEGSDQAGGRNFLQQQAKFDDFIECYNRNGPHQALDMKYPAELYRPSPRPIAGSMSCATRSTTTPSPSPVRSHLLPAPEVNSPLSSPARTSASSRWPTRSGWSASCNTTWGSSMTKLVASNLR